MKVILYIATLYCIGLSYYAVYEVSAIIHMNKKFSCPKIDQGAKK